MKNAVIWDINDQFIPHRRHITCYVRYEVFTAVTMKNDRHCGLIVKAPRFDSLRYQMFCVAVGLELGPLSLVRINEELLERKVRLRSRKQRLTTVGNPPR
jgi:hypothetical protein